MPETIPQIRPSFNRSLRLETRPELLSADTGALVQWELMDRSGLIDWLTERLHDPRHPSSIRYPLSDLLRTRLLLLGQGWRDQSDADRLRQDPSLRVASQTRRGMPEPEREGDWFHFQVPAGVARNGMNEVGLISNVPAAGPFAGLIGPPNADPAEFLKQAFGRVKNVIRPDQDPVMVH